MPELHIGLMSGTSLDGIDAALVDFANGADLVHALTAPFPDDLQHTLQAIIQQPDTVTVDQLAQADARLGETYAAVVKQLLIAAKLSPADIRSIGCHGQTIRHRPDLTPAYTWQLGDPSRIAAATGVITVADFRRMNMALGGEGAPLAPAFHDAVFQQPGERRVVLNIGGIANITVLEEPVTGYDTGPGNGLMNAWIEQHQDLPFDRDGAWAMSGKRNDALLADLLDDAYFDKPAPKSTGREHFNLEWLITRIAGRHLAPADVQATLLALTVESIVRELQAVKPDRVLVCGGGARNKALMNALAATAPGPVQTTDEFGLDADFVEAAAMAWYARERLAGRAVRLSHVTGATRDAPLGAVFLPPPGTDK